MNASAPARLSGPAAKDDVPSWARASAEVAEELGVDPVAGLSPDDAALRLLEAGPNVIERERGTSIWRSAGRQLKDAMILVLLGAGALTLVIGDFADAAVILLVVTVNTVTGAWQERRAIEAIDALRSMAAPVAVVRRGGATTEIEAADVVLGDVLVLREGDVVPADGRLLTAHELTVDEALLTGESLPSHRDADAIAAPDTTTADRHGMVHAGTLVVHGSGTAVVVATGELSCIGGISRLLRQARVPATPLQRRLGRLGQWLSLGAVVVCAVIGVLGLLRGQSFEVVLVTAISLAVAAIPESLPAVVVLSLASGARRMARRGAIVRSLGAVETLGSVTVLASDKTGTLTSGEMVAVATWTPDAGEQQIAAGHPLTGGPDWLSVLAGAAPGPQALLTAAVLCNDAAADASSGGFTEVALVQAATAAGIDARAARQAFPRTGVVPFDRDRRDMSTTHRFAGGQLTITKGAPEAVLDRLAPSAAQDPGDTAVVWATAGRRVIAVCATVNGGQARLLGLVAIADPVKPEAAEAIRACASAGITMVLITGDHPGTAAAIADQTGLLATPNGGAADVGERIYARADPGTKLRLVSDWQRGGEVVAMTGDGVNDAPALRAADIGVAMGRRGTDVARGAADLVLTDDSLATIVAAVAEGRRVYDNVRRFVRYGLAGGGAELLIMLLGPLFGFALPLLAGQILWVNLLTHGLPGVAIGAEQAEPDVLERTPRPPAEPILTRALAAQTLGYASVLATVCLGVAAWARSSGAPWQAALFATLALGQLGLALATRSDTIPIWRIPLGSNRMLTAAVTLSAALMLAALYFPPLQSLLRTTGLSAGVLLVVAGAATIPAVLAQVLVCVRSALSSARS